MSKLETPMTRWYWNQIGGTLVEEFLLTPRTATSQMRLLDGLIIPSGENRIARTSEVDLTGREVISVQTKDSNLGMYLLGQTLFSQLLIYRNYEPAHVDAVALCRNDDEVLHELALTFADLTIVTVPDHIRAG
jgi:hypothetical protein